MADAAEELEELRPIMDVVVAGAVTCVVMLPVLKTRWYARQDPRLAPQHRAAEGIRV